MGDRMGRDRPSTMGNLPSACCLGSGTCAVVWNGSSTEQCGVVLREHRPLEGRSP